MSVRIRPQIQRQANRPLQGTNPCPIYCALQHSPSGSLIAPHRPRRKGPTHAPPWTHCRSPQQDPPRLDGGDGDDRLDRFVVGPPLGNDRLRRQPRRLVAKTYIPQTLAPGAALVVVLHGCTQNAGGLRPRQRLVGACRAPRLRRAFPRADARRTIAICASTGTHRPTSAAGRARRPRSRRWSAT